MASMKRPRFAALKALPGHRSHMTFTDGTEATVEFAPFFDESPGLAPLRDGKAFGEVCIGEDAGWTAEWPRHDIQIGADTLWLDAQSQNAPDENTRIFAQWRARNPNLPQRGKEPHSSPAGGQGGGQRRKNVHT